MKPLILPVPPSGNRYWRKYRGRTVKSHEARLYQEGIWQLASRHRKYKVPTGQDVAVRVVWERTTRRGDLDNRVKVLLDALNGIAWDDDKQVALLEVIRVEGASADAMTVVWRSVAIDASSAASYLDRPWPPTPGVGPVPDAPAP